METVVSLFCTDETLSVKVAAEADFTYSGEQLIAAREQGPEMPGL